MPQSSPEDDQEQGLPGHISCKARVMVEFLLFDDGICAEKTIAELSLLGLHKHQEIFAKHAKVEN